MNKMIFFLVLLNAFGCSGLGQKVSKRVTKASRFPASEEKGFRPSHIGSDIGTIKYSMLNESTFQRINGEGWVLMNGRCVESLCCKNKIKKGSSVTCETKDSDYFKLTGEKEIPDSRGKFLRAKNNGIKSEDCPDKYKDKNCFDQEGERDLGSYQGDDFKSHTHVTTANVGNGTARNGAMVPTGIKSPRSNSEAAGGNETRPKNIAVNIFIKIND